MQPRLRALAPLVAWSFLVACGEDPPSSVAPDVSDAVSDVGTPLPDVGAEPDVLTAGDAAPPDAPPPTDAGEDTGEPPADTGEPPAALVIINEVLTDGSAEADANGDGTVDATEDELVEIVNVSDDALDLGGWTVVESDFDTSLPRYTAPAGLVLPPGGVLVVFGGGEPPESTTQVLYVTANAPDPGIPFGLDLDDAEDTVRVLNADGVEVASAAWGTAETPATSDQSLTRAPDLTGPFVPHTEAPGAGGAALSPGTRADGSPFSP